MDMGTEQRAQTPSPIQALIESETETDRGWVFAVEIAWKGAGMTEHEVALAWVDHDALSGGVEPPSELARRAALIGARSIGRHDLPERFDIATLRRAISGFTDRLMNDPA